ncbi:hypothetical protein B0T25DRAFT_488742 [Lasiosphaeria hispida]|uniref:Uncharacterized protein n=1 Tax=Lasiosphaeria hispida TaxID=260671 RepID=A0AAJ0H708_9PEZI|nr:hypothetical protein B0T25DRAFT_488742 [Lasiosphaeria hispida]
MNDQDASPPSHLRSRRSTRQSTNALDRDRAATSSFEKTDTGAESSRLSAFTPDSTLGPRSSEDAEPPAQTPPRSDNPHDDDARRRSRVQHPHRAHKHRSSGAFLLGDPVSDTVEHDTLTHTHSHKRHRHSEIHVEKSARRGQERPHHKGAQSSSAYGHGSGGDRDSPSAARSELLTGETAVGSSPRASMAPLDMDSAQIVKMALNLSESRRLATRRNVSQPIPPRLAPLPDAPINGSLRQHLQQQRRVSRTISPKPDRSPRVGAPRLLSPLQSAFDPDGTYRYHFSQSTLARAQKAKEYLELMAQYRRVLELLPPLEPSRTVRSSTVSPPRSPNGSVQLLKLPASEPVVQIGRQYDPLQYIRNRKVRARERKVIDGESQGFNDTMRVSEWVDGVAKWVVTGQAQTPGGSALPPFAGADMAIAQGSPPSASTRSGVASTKTKRPRVDWVLDPADMLADIYWLEQDDNKKLVEDRHWRRVFPQDTDVFRPLSREEGMRTAAPGSTKELSESLKTTDTAFSDPLPHKAEHEHVLSSARDRAQQKLRALKGSHHRHSGSMHSRDFLRIHRGSLSESSDTDTGPRRRTRTGTISSSGKDILAKQMEEMIAREQRDAESHPLYDHEALRMKLAGPSLMTPEKDKARTSPSPSRPNSHRRVDPHAELSESDSRYSKIKPLPSPPQVSGRASLEVPQRGRRPSIDYDTSQPNSPDLRPLRDIALVPAIGMDLSPTSSRPSSPTRNRLLKVRSIFRERSKERPADIHPNIQEDVEFSFPPAERVDSPASDWSGMNSPERRNSRSPPRKVTSKVTDGSRRSHRSMGSIKLRGEDGGIGLRSLFRGPRIDIVLRSGVSKVSDLIWRKDSVGTADEPSSSTSSDESGMDNLNRGRSRGRSKGSLLPSRATSQRGQEQSGRPYLGVPNPFLNAADQNSLLVPGSSPVSRPISRRSSRFELLKPPRIDVQNASPTSSSPTELARPHDNDVTESDLRKSSYGDAIRAADARLNAVLSLSRPPQLSPAMSTRRLSMADGLGEPNRAAISKHEIARLRALLLNFGIHAMEINRRAKEQKLLPSLLNIQPAENEANPSPFLWSHVARLCPDPEIRDRLLTRPIAKTDLYPLAARGLGALVQASASQWQAASDAFAAEMAPALERRVDALRNKVADELTGKTQAAAEEADEASHDLVTEQRLKVQRVVDVIDKMLRRRRRRFRWVRRAGWLGVEWVLVGFMWYVWFVVMIARVVLGMAKGIAGTVRWLLWL